MFLSKGCQIFKTFSEILLDLQARFGFLPLVFLQCAAVSTTRSGGCRCELWLTMFRDVHDDGGRPNHGGFSSSRNVWDILAILSRLGEWGLWLTMIRGRRDDGGRPNYGCVRNEVWRGVCSSWDVWDILAILSRLGGWSPVPNVLECQSMFASNQ